MKKGLSRFLSAIIEIADSKEKIYIILVVGIFVYEPLLSQSNYNKKQIPIKKANIVLFLCDDYDIFYANAYGKQKVNTPNIDQLSRDGMVFNRAFTSTAMCTPSRSMLYTGLFPHRNGADQNDGVAYDGVKSIPQYLNSLGYRVVLAGKTHITPKTVFPFEYIDLDEVEKFVKDSHEQPFCLIVASKQPHRPFETGGYDPKEVVLPPFLVDSRETRQLIADYCTDINIVDKEVGDVLIALNKSQLDKNTLFIFTSDHGGPFPFAKWTCYDSGLHIPFIARWPGQIEPGSLTDAMISFVDVLPTFIDMAGGVPPKNLDGKSFLSVLLDKTHKFRKLMYGTHTNLGVNEGNEYPIRAVRSDRFKYIVNLNPYGTFTNQITSHEKFGKLWNSWIEKAKRDTTAAQLVLRYLHRPVEEFYDLNVDPYELNNIARDPSNRDSVLFMRKELMDWMVQQNDPKLDEMKKLMSSDISIH